MVCPHFIWMFWAGSEIKDEYQENRDPVGNGSLDMMAAQSKEGRIWLRTEASVWKAHGLIAILTTWQLEGRKNKKNRATRRSISQSLL
jgi:hypothetical protein